jgi:poly(3-hydroxybutyrate) depolymerase
MVTATGGAGASGGGSAGASGSVSGGAGAGGGTSGVDVDAAKPSTGCGKPADIAPGEFAMSTATGRSTWIRLPADYDPMRAYPVIFVWKGCGAAGRATFGMENIAGNDAIIAQGDFPPGQSCYDTADGALFVDLPVFDALLSQIETNYCADQAHVFSVGFSSGAWLTQLLACQRGNVLRGIGTIAGGFKPTFFNGAPTCMGGGLSAFMVSDLDDHENPFYDEDDDGDSVEIAVNQWLGVNGCSEKAWTTEAGMPAEPDQAVCRAYAGCGRFPVELCLTTGKGHSAQDALSWPGFWQLFQQSLPK